jgi:glycine/D-amino acid oxidase-like deaminating enzyme
VASIGLPPRRDVVIVGGGILGLSSAYELARTGLSVLVIERDRAGGNQSGRNLGFVRQQGRDVAELPIMMAANRRWRSLSAELGTDVEWVMGGNLRLTNDPALAARYEEWAKLAASMGLDSRVVTDDEIAPILGAPGKWGLGIFTASDGHADPVATCAAYAEAARAHGVEIVEGLAVRAIATAAGAIAGVVTDIGEVRAATVVLAAGAASTYLARPLGIRLPQRLVRQTVVLTEPVERVTRAACWTGELFVRQDVRGSLRLAAAGRNQVVLDPRGLREAPRFVASYLANRSQLRVGLDPASLLRATVRPLVRRAGEEQSPRGDPADVAYCLDAVRRTFPRLAEVRLRRVWAGEIDATPDALPVLDAPGSHPGLVLATGMSGHGFGVSPVIGEIVARLVEGAEVGFDLKPFRLGRFSDGSRLEPAHLL